MVFVPLWSCPARPARVRAAGGRVIIRGMTNGRTLRAGESVEDFCRACKTDRMHTIIAVDAAGIPLRVVCGYCDSKHNYRGGPRVGTPGGTAVRPSVAPRACLRAGPRTVTARERP